MRLPALAVALALLLGACSEDFFDPTPGGDSADAPAVELVGENIRMIPGEANAVRIAFKPKDVSARVQIARSSTEGRVTACALRTIDDPLPPVDRCIPDLPHRVRETLTIAGLGAVVLVREGDPIEIDLRLEYEEGRRDFSIRIPSVQRPPGASICKDNACNPFFEVRPVRAGCFRVTASWSGGPARLELLEGRVLARAFSSTGIPYRIAAGEGGPGPLSLTAQLNAPSEYALALTNTGGGDLSGIRIDATWP
jgi:hypothetical protein